MELSRNKSKNGYFQLVAADRESFRVAKWFCWFFNSLFLQIKPRESMQWTSGIQQKHNAVLHKSIFTVPLSKWINQK